MATRVLPLLCILFLIFSGSLLVLPSTGAARTLAESKDGGVSLDPINPNRPRGPYLPRPRPCSLYRPCHSPPTPDGK